MARATLKRPADRGSFTRARVKRPAYRGSFTRTRMKRPAYRGSFTRTRVKRPADRGSFTRTRVKRPADRGSFTRTRVKRPADRGSFTRTRVKRPADRGSFTRTRVKRPADRGSFPQAVVKRPADRGTFPPAESLNKLSFFVLDRASTVTTVDSDVSDRGKHRGSLKYAQGGRFLHSSRRVRGGRFCTRVAESVTVGHVVSKPLGSPVGLDDVSDPIHRVKNWSGVRGNAPVKNARVCGRSAEWRDLWLGPR